MHRHSVVVLTFAKMAVCLRNLLAKLKVRWNIFRSSVQPYLSYDCDRCLDLVMIFAGIRPLAGPESWKRNCLTLYRLLGFYQIIVVLVNVPFSIQNREDLVELFAPIMMAMVYTIASVKIFILKHYEEDVMHMKASLRSNIGHSCDPEFDASVRQGARRTVGKITLAVFFIICCDQVLLWVPNSARERILGIPKQIQVLGPMAAAFLQGAYFFTMACFWGNRYTCTTLTIISILMGLRSELMIVARGFETIEERVLVQVSADQNHVAGTSRRRPSDDELRWKYLKQILKTSVEQHVEVLRNIQLVQPIVSQLYAIIHYSTMTIVSLLVFLVIRGSTSFVEISLVLGGMIFVLECYCWCKLTELIQDTMEKIADSVAQLGFRLKHSVENHSEYTQMRTSLMIVQLNAARGEWFSCGGFFPISVESFRELCMTIYSFATFLLDLD